MYIVKEKISLRPIILRLALLLCAITFAIFLLFYFEKSSCPTLYNNIKPMCNVPISAEISGKKLFLANADKLQIYFPKLQEMLSISLIKERPGRKNSAQKAILYIQGSENKEITLGTKIFLNIDSKNLHFANNSSNIWLECRKINDNAIEIKLDYSSIEGVEFTKIPPLTLTPVKNKSSNKAATASLNPISSALWFGRDLFLEKIDHKSSEKIVIANQTFFLSEGEGLVWLDGKWQKQSLLTETSKCPLIKINNINNKKLVLDSWDELDNYFVFELSLITKSSPLQLKIEELLSQVRLHSKKTISCFLNKRHRILKEGDWVVKKDKMYKVLKTAKEKKAFLSSPYLGEIFILDSINNSKAQISFFNAFHDQMLSIDVPIIQQKRELPKSNLNHERRI